MSPPPPRSFARFGLLWLGQVVSVFGSELTSFALGVWVYQSTGSATQFALVAFLTALPSVVLSPVTGAVVDRFPRRWVMILSDSGAAVVTFVLLYLVRHDALETWHLYVAVSMSAIFSSFQWPALAATTTLLVPKEQLTRASGMMQAGFAVAAMLAPLTAGILLVTIQLQGVILVDVATFVFAVLTLLAVRVPQPTVRAESESESAAEAEGQSFWADVVYGWTYVRARRGLLALLGMFAGFNLCLGMVQILFVPLLLSFTDAPTLGRVLTAAALGAVGGGLLMAVWGGPKRRIYAIYAAIAAQGVILVLGGLREHVPTITVAAFGFMFCSGIVGSSSQPIWQSKVAPEIQGRVFAMRRMIATASVPLGYLLGGPTGDLFEPLLLPGGPLAGTALGNLVGTGPGRGTGLLFMTLGALVFLMVLVAFRYKPLRNLEIDLPDAVETEDAGPDDAPSSGSAAGWGRRLLQVTAGSLAVVALLVAGVGLWLRSQLHRSLPVEEGRLDVPGLGAEVEVRFDDLGIPEIRGERRLDVAVATGFLHAQNRFFQMDLMRRQAAGELSELLGETTLDADRQIRIHRLRRRAEQALANLPTGERELADAYTAGVNAGLAALDAKPFEYSMLRSEPQPWRSEDSVLVLLAMFIQLQDEIGNAESAMGLLYEELPDSLAAFVAPRGTEWDSPLLGEPFPTPPVPGPEEADLRQPRQADLGPVELWLGPPDLPPAASNAWVVAGSHTADGAALLASDMHLPLAVPNVWYRASFVWPEGGGERHVTGVTLPGLPAMVVGSNGDVAWALANLQGDTGDVVLLDPVPGDEDAYRTPEGPRRYERHEEVIAVRGGKDEHLEVLTTLWGPVLDGMPRRSFRWVASEEGALDFALFGLETARTVREILDVANRTGGPALSLLAADRDGGIGWTVVGRLPRRVGFDGRQPTSWSDGSRRWEGLLPPENVPRIVDPESGRLWVANNRLMDGEGLSLLGDGGYVLGARAKQIRDALFALESATERDMLAVQLDDRALFLAHWRDLLLSVLTPEALSADTRRIELRRLVEDDWNGHAAVDSAGYRLVAGFRVFVVRNVFTHLTAACAEADPAFLTRVESNQFEGPLWRLVTERPLHFLPAEYADWDELFLASINDELSYYRGVGKLAENTWGRRNTTAIHHPLAVLGLGRWLNMKPVELPGDEFMPRVQNPVYGASMRMVVSPGQEDEGIFHMPGGQSGHPSSPHYRDGYDAWVEGLPTPFLPGETVERLLLLPASSR